MGENCGNVTCLWAEAGTSTPIRGIARSQVSTGSHAFEEMNQTAWNATRQMALAASSPPTASERDDVRDAMTAAGADFFENTLVNDDERDAYIVSFHGASAW